MSEWAFDFKRGFFHLADSTNWYRGVKVFDILIGDFFLNLFLTKDVNNNAF